MKEKKDREIKEHRQRIQSAQLNKDIKENKENVKSSTKKVVPVKKVVLQKKVTKDEFKKFKDDHIVT